MKLVIKDATKENVRLRLGLIGPAGSGKTWTALEIARYFAKRLDSGILVIDTEHESSAKYADNFKFKILPLTESQHPQHYIDALALGVKSGFKIIVIDSLSHAWSGKEGALALVDNATKNSRSGNSYMAWREVTPLHNALVDAMLGCEAHLIVTMRAKTEYVIEEDERGKKVPRKIGQAPVQREGLDYEFDVVGDMDWQNSLAIGKTRCPDLARKTISLPGEAFAETLWTWTTTVKPALPTEPEPTTEMTITEPAYTVPRATPPVLAQLATPDTIEPPTKSYITAVTAEQKRIGDVAFAAALARFGVTSPAELLGKEVQRNFYAALKAA